MTVSLFLLEVASPRSAARAPAPSAPGGLRLARLGSPLGGLLAVTDAEERLRGLEFEAFEPRLRCRFGARASGGNDPLVPGRAPAALREALEAYFEGALPALDAIPLAPAGTAFQQEVWAALRRIPAGSTRSYGEIARALGRPRACRAVGLAAGANPIALVVPCHRAIGADGSLTGYAGGLERKRWLLEHERRHAGS